MRAEVDASIGSGGRSGRVEPAGRAGADTAKFAAASGASADSSGCHRADASDPGGTRGRAAGRRFCDSDRARPGWSRRTAAASSDSASGRHA